MFKITFTMGLKFYRILFAGLVLGICSITIGANGCPWSKDKDDNEGAISGSSALTAPTQFTAIAATAGSDHNLALSSDKTIWSWGRANYGQLGVGTTIDCLTPTWISGLSNVTKLAAGGLHSLALCSDGTAHAWGSNEYGQLGDGTNNNQVTPIVISGLNNAITIAAGAYHSLALCSDGTVKAWGYNHYGQLGNGSTLNCSTPNSITALTGITVTALVAGGYHSLALLSDGTVLAWGSNFYGQLGNDTKTDSATPVLVTGLTGCTITAIAAGWYHNLALCSDGTVRAWGWNSDGQLGNGTMIDATTPVTVSGLTNVMALAAGYAHSLALLSDHTMCAWGSNDSGQLGDGTTQSRLNIVALIGLTDVIAVAAGYHHSLAILSDGTFKTWGSNVSGQLGNATTDPVIQPVEISNLPAPPTDLELAVISSSRIDLSWNSNSNNESGFKIERKTAVANAYAEIALVDSAITFYANTDLSDGITYYYRVRAYNAAGASAYSNEASATTIPFPAAQASIPTPADAAINILPNQQLSWAAATRATSYSVYLDTDNPPTTFKVNQAGTTYNPGTLNTNTTYYWQIDANNAGGTTAGVVWSFTTAPPPPAQTATPNPANAGINVATNQQLSWAAASGATGYDVYFDATTNPPTTLRSSNQPGITYNPGALNNSTIYYWKINAKNGGGTTTGAVWSFTTIPTAPGQAGTPNPANAAVNVATNKQLSWAAASGATGYDVYFDTVNPPVVLTSSNQAGITYNPLGMTTSKIYYWKINAKNAGGTTAGVVWGFTTVPPAPAQASTPSPTDAAIDRPTNQQLGWAAASGATGYDVYFDATTNPPTTLRSNNQPGITYNPGTLNTSTTYYWKINAKNAGGTTAGTVWGFTTVPPPPAQASTPSPDNATTDRPTNQQLGWAAASGATGYDVYFDATINPPTTLRSSNQPGITYNPGALNNSTIYYWKINAKNVGGTTTGAVWNFTTVPVAPPQVGSPNPANTAINMPTNQQLSWAAASGATGYDVYFDATINPPTTLRSSNQPGITYNPGTLNTSTIYYWKINAKNAGGTTPGAVWSFTTAAPGGPAQVDTPNPSDAASNVATNQQLSWAAATGATGYDVYFDTVNPPVVLTSSNQAGITYNPLGMTNNQTYYWRIDSKSAGGTTTGNIWHFTTIPPPPAQAGTPSPNNAAIDVATNQQLSWAAATGATGYDVYFDTVNPPVVLTSSNQAGITYNPLGMTNNQTYYWRIDSKNGSGTTIGINWSFTTVPAAPAQVGTPSPADIAIDRPTNQQLGWAAASGATGYDVYFDTVNPPAVLTSSNQAGITYNPLGMTTSKTYYWRIDSKNAGGTTAGTVWSFTTVPATPAQAGTPNPSDAASNVATNQQLSWAAASGATGYDVYFDTVNPPAVLTSSNQAGITYNPLGMTTSKTYYWRIDPKNAGGTTIGINWSFTTVPPAPAQVGTPNPADIATDRPTNQQLGWAAASGATGYDVYFDATTNPPTTLRSSNQPGITYDPGALNTGTTYYWKINSKNAGGTTAGLVWRFTTVPAAPAQAGTPNPANAASNVATNQQLSWGAASGATGYDVYFDTVNPPVVLTSSNQAGITYNPLGMTTSKTYYWRIDSKNAGGTTIGINWSFTTVPAAPAQVGTPSPADAATDRPTNQQLSWAAASGATGYDVYFDATTNPPTTLRSSNQPGITYNPGALNNSTIYYWKINSKNAGGTTTGLVWSFTTVSGAPPKVTTPTPANGATGIPTNQQLSWAAASGATGYDVYFDATINPPTTLRSSNQPGTTYNPGALANSTPYYWRIDSKNASGTTTGDVWSFTTVGAGGIPNAPIAPCSVTGAGPGLLVSWTDNSLTETGFKIYRATGATQPPDGNYTLKATVGAGAGTGGVQTYTDTSATVITTKYWYKVTSYNGSGESARLDCGGHFGDSSQ